MDAKVMAGLKKLKTALNKTVKSNSREIKKNGEGTAENLTKMAELRDQIVALRKVVEEQEVSGSAAARQGGGRDSRSIGKKFTASPEYKTYRESRGGDASRATGKVIVGRMFQKAVPVDYGDTNAGSLVIPFYRPDLIETPLPMPFMRDLVTVIPTSATNSIKIDREVADRELAAVATADVAIGETVFAVDNTVGFETVVPFNTITLDNGTTTEDLTITSIDASAKTITTTSVSTITMVAGDAYYGAKYVTTPEGAIVPRNFTKWEDYTVSIVDLFTFVKATLDKLRDVAGLEDVINRRSLASVARMETVNMLYAPGNSGQMQGIFQDSNITELTWSAQASGTNIFDFFLTAFYALAIASFEADALVVHPAVHKLFVDMKASDGHYLFLPALSDAAPERVMAIRFMWSPLLQPTHGVLADWSSTMTIYDREEAEISIGTDGDDFTKRKRTIMAGERVGFGAELPAGIRRMIFDAPPAAS